jgi:hypothetical protein
MIKTKFRTEALTEFENKHLPAIKFQPMPESVTQKYSDKIPDLLFDFWTKYGCAGFANGLIWVVNPDDFSHILKEWLKAEFQDAFVFARTAFGDLFLINGHEVFILRVQEGAFRSLSNDLSRFIYSTLCNKDYLKNGLSNPLFKKALAKLGTLERDECYAIVPSLTLGGEFKIEYLQKTKLQPYLALLLQLHQ